MWRNKNINPSVEEVFSNQRGDEMINDSNKLFEDGIDKLFSETEIHMSVYFVKDMIEYWFNYSYIYFL